MSDFRSHVTLFAKPSSQNKNTSTPKCCCCQPRTLLVAQQSFVKVSSFLQKVSSVLLFEGFWPICVISRLSEVMNPLSFPFTCCQLRGAPVPLALLMDQAVLRTGHFRPFCRHFKEILISRALSFLQTRTAAEPGQEGCEEL